MSDEPVFSRRLGLLADHIEAGYHVSREVTVNLLRRAASAERANVLESQRDLLRHEPTTSPQMPKRAKKEEHSTASAEERRALRAAVRNREVI